MDRKNEYHHIVLGVASLLLVLPAIMHPPMLHDSFWIDWVWADQFTAELAKGNLYPRWLPRSHDGLGSPVFYFYPPLAFYVSGAFGLAGLPTYASVIATFWAALLASGYAMHLWLKAFAPRPLLGSLLFMAAPYHLIDFYGRGAQAEFLAVAFIPLVAWSMREDRPNLLALSYAGLILSHMPLALLVSVFLIAPYALYLKKPLRSAWPLVLGVSLSAVYLWPALALEPYRDAASLWSQANLRPENWTVLSSTPVGPMRLTFGLILVASAPAIVALRVADQRALAIYAAVCAAFAAGLVPGFWSLPVLEKVQFPFRLLPMMEFALATGAAMIVRPLLLAAWIPALFLSTTFTLQVERQRDWTIAELSRLHPDVPENLPLGERPYSWPSQWALETATANPGATFWFPSWEAECRTEFMIPAECGKRLTMTQAEVIGLVITLLSLILLLHPAVRLGSRGSRPG